MRIASIGLRAVEWPAPPNASNARSTWTRREGIAITLQDDAGRAATGVAAPLPGYTRDTLEAARSSLGTCAWLSGLELPRLSTKAHEDALAALLARVESPAARYAVETAILELADGSPWLESTTPIRRAALVDTFDLDAAAEAVRRGAVALKLKIGRPGRLDEELASVRRAAALAPVRVDANRTLDAAAAPALAELPVEFVEEPGVRTAGVALALDESLLDPNLDDRLADQDVVAIVLKPMVLGGLLECLKLARRARAHGVEAIASHTFDGPMSAGAVRLARLLPATRFAHGIPDATPS